MDLFPSSTIQQQPTRQQQGGPGLAEKWRGWMQKPENAALLMQAGIAMLQPMQIGQSTAGAIASSVGQGFEARDRVRANTAASQTDAQKLAMEQEELNLRRDEGQAKKEYYKRLGGGGISASTLFRTDAAAQARKQKAWMDFLAEEQFQNPDVQPEELWPAFEQAWNLAEQQSSAPAGATPSVPLPSAAAPSEGPVQTATNPKTGEKLKLVGGKWIPM